MKKIILIFILGITLIGVVKVIWEENQIERIYMLNK